MSGSPAFKSFTVTPSSFPGSVICNWTFDASYVDTSNVFFITIYANDSNVTDSIVDNRKFSIRNIINEQGSITNTYEVDNLSTDYPYFFTVEVRVSKVYKPTFRNTYAVYTSNSVNYQLPSSPIVPTFKLGQDLDDGFYIKLTDPSNQNINPTVGSLYDGNSVLKGLFVSINNSELGLFSVFFAQDASTNLYTDKLRVPVNVSYGVYDVALTSMNDFKMFSDQSEFKSIIVDHTPGEPTSVIVKKYYPSYDQYFDTPSIEVKIMAPEYKGRPAINYFKVYRADYNTSLLSSDPSNNNYIFLGDISANYDVNENLDSSFSYVDSLDLIPGSYYKYKVFSHSECGQNDGLSLVPTLSSPIVASIYPDQATGLNMWTTSATSLDASWNHSDNFSGIEDNYLVYNLILTDASDSDVSPENVTTLNVITSNTHYSFTGLVAGRKYILRVYAGVYDDEEFLQNFFNTIQPAPLYLGSPYDIQGLTSHVPTNLRIKPNVNRMTYYWDAPSNPSGLTLSGYNLSLYKQIQIIVPGVGYQWVDEETPIQTASIVTDNEYTFYGLKEQTQYTFKVSAKYYIGNDTTKVVYSSISSVYSQTPFEPVYIILNAPTAFVNQKKVNITWQAPNYDNLYDASYNIYRRIKDVNGNILEETTLIATVFDSNNSLRTYVDDSDQTTYFTFGNKIEYYIEAIYKDRVNNYLYPAVTSDTDFSVLYITPLNFSDVRAKPIKMLNNSYGTYYPGVTIKWTNPVIPANSGLEIDRFSIIIKAANNPGGAAVAADQYISKTITEYTTEIPNNYRFGSHLLIYMTIIYTTGREIVMGGYPIINFYAHLDPIAPVLTVTGTQGLRKGVLSWTLDTDYDNYNATSEVYREIVDSTGTTVEENKLLKTLTNIGTFTDNSTDLDQSPRFIFGNTIRYYVKVSYTDLSNNWLDGVYAYAPFTSNSGAVVLFNATPLPTGLKVIPLDKHLTLEWTAPDMTDSGMELLNYYIYLNDEQLLTISDLSNLSYTYNDLSNNVTYSLSVSANYKLLGGTTLIPSVPQSILGTPHTNPAVPLLTASSLQTERNIGLNWTIDNNYAHYSTSSKIYREIKNADDVVLEASELITTLANVSTFNDTHNAVNQSVHFIYGNKITYYVDVIYTDLSNSHVNNVYVYDAVTSTSKYVIMYDNTTTPQHLTVLPSDGQLTLSWSAPNNSSNGLTVTSYNLYLDASYVANVDKLYTSYAYNVTNGQSHTLSVEAVNSAGTVTGVTSAAVSITGIAHAAPAVPVLTVNEVAGEKKVELSWTLDTSYPHYTTVTKIYRQILGADGVTLDASVLIKTLSNVNTYDDIDNGENKSSHFVYGNTIKYYVAIAYTDLSNNQTDGVYIYADVTSTSKSSVIYGSPSSPTGLTVAPSNGHLTLSWTSPDNSTNGLTVTGYNVYLESNFVALVSSSTTTFEYTVTNGQTKTLSVESVNSAISSVVSETVTGVTSSKASISGIAHADPSVPVLTANEVQGEKKVELSWTIDDSYLNYLTVIKVYRAIVSATGVVLQSNVLINTLYDSNAYTDIDNGENQSAHFAYGNTMTYYVVITYTDIANSFVDGVYTYADVTSTSKSAVIYNNPSSPTGLTVAPSNGHLTLSWVAPNNSTNGLSVTGYNVYLDSVSVALVSSSTTSFEYTVTNGQVKTLSVESVNSAISSVVDVTVTGITSASASITGISHTDPAVPVLTANEVQGQTKVELSWTIDSSYLNYLTVIKVYREILSATGVVLQSNALIKTLYDSNAYDDIDNGENQSAHFAYGNTMTYYVVITYTDIANSFVEGVYTYADVTSASKSAVIYDNASSPTGLTVVPSDGQLTLSWTPANNTGKGVTVTGYNLYLDSNFVAVVNHDVNSYSYNLTNGQTHVLGVQSVNSAISSVEDVTVTGLLSSVQTANGKAYQLATTTLIANATNANNGVQTGKTVLLTFTVDNSQSTCSSVEIYRKISSHSNATLENFTLIDTVTSNLVSGENRYIDRDTVQHSVNFLNGNTMKYHVKLNYSDSVNSYSYQVISNDDFTVPYDRPTPTNYIGQPVTNKACIIPLDLNNGEFTQFNLVFSKNGSDITTIVAVGLTNGGNGTVLQYSSSSSVVIGNVSVNNQNNNQIDGVCAANQVKVVTCSFPSPVTDVTDVLAFINNQAGSLLTSYPIDGIFLP